MSLHPKLIKPVPKETEQVAKAAFPKGNLYLTIRDELGTIYTDKDFEALFSLEGQECDRSLAVSLDLRHAIYRRVSRQTSRRSSQRSY